MQLVPPIYDENWKSTDLKYEKVNVVKLMTKKSIFLAQSPLLPQRQGDCPHSVESITGRHPAHLSSVTSAPCPPPLSLKFRGPLFLIFSVLKKCTVDHVPPSPPNSCISICFGYKTLFSTSPMIIISDSFRNTSNYVK